MARYKSFIGRFEPITLPDQLLSDIPAKVDTGASISSIHATDIEEFVKDKKKHLRFTVLSDHKAYDYSREIVVTSFSQKKIENSFGHSEMRYLVTLRVKVGKKTFKAKFTLADRSKKSFPVLLGREMLNGRFIVDTSVSNVSKKLLEQRIPKVLKEDSEE